MADTYTSNYNFTKPEPGASTDTWGEKLNTNWDNADSQMKSTADAAATLAAEKLAKAGDSMTGDLSFGDNNKAVFGAGSDLQIYHDGSDSYVTDQGTGNLVMQGTNLRLQNSAGTDYLYANNGGAVSIAYGGDYKLATTSTGITVTGVMNADSVYVSTGDATSPSIKVQDSNTGFYDAGSDAIGIATGGVEGGVFDPNGLTIPASRYVSAGTFISGSGSEGSPAIQIGGADTGLFDAGSNAVGLSTGGVGRLYVNGVGDVGIGTDTPLCMLHIENTSANDGIRIISGTSGEGFLVFGDTADTNTGSIAYNHTDNAMTFDVNNAQRMVITSDGRLGVGETTPTTRLHVNSAGLNHVAAFESTDTSAYITIKDSASTSFNYIQGGSDDLVFGTNNTARLKIDSAGNLGINTTDPQRMVHLYGATPDIMIGNTSETPSGIVWEDANAGDPATQRAAIKWDAGSTYSNSIVFFNNDEDAPRMAIDMFGNVGINTVSPGANLDIVGATARLQNAGDVTFTLNADTSNNNENYHPEIRFLQDGTHHMLSVGSEGTAGFSYTGTGSNSAYIMGGDGHNGTVDLHFGTNNTVQASLDTAGQFFINSGYGSVARTYGVRAWCSYNSSTDTIRGSGNVSSITNIGTGQDYINFIYSMPDTNYAVTSATDESLNGGDTAALSVRDLATNRFWAEMEDVDAGGVSQGGMIAVFR